MYEINRSIGAQECELWGETPLGSNPVPFCTHQLWEQSNQLQALWLSFSCVRATVCKLEPQGSWWYNGVQVGRPEKWGSGGQWFKSQPESQNQVRWDVPTQAGGQEGKGAHSFFLTFCSMCPLCPPTLGRTLYLRVHRFKCTSVPLTPSQTQADRKVNLGTLGQSHWCTKWTTLWCVHLYMLVLQMLRGAQKWGSGSQGDLRRWVGLHPVWSKPQPWMQCKAAVVQLTLTQDARYWTVRCIRLMVNVLLVMLEVLVFFASSFFSYFSSCREFQEVLSLLRAILPYFHISNSHLSTI